MAPLLATAGRAGEGEKAVCSGGTTRRVKAPIIERGTRPGRRRGECRVPPRSGAAAEGDAGGPAWYSHRLFRAALPTQQAPRPRASARRRLVPWGSHAKDFQMYAVIKT